MRVVVLVCLSLAYPLLIYWGRDELGPQILAVLPLSLLLLRGSAAWREPKDQAMLAVALLIAAWALVSNDLLALKIYPVLISVVLLAVFGYSLINPPTVIERLATLQRGPLSADAKRYTRNVTKVWCGFFILNGATTAALALWSSDQLWALYTGIISYVLMGLLFAIEWLVRRRVQARNSHG